MSITINDIPTEPLSHILSYLDLRDKCSTVQVNSLWREATMLTMQVAKRKIISNISDNVLNENEEAITEKINNLSLREIHLLSGRQNIDFLFTEVNLNYFDKAIQAVESADGGNFDEALMITKTIIPEDLKNTIYCYICSKLAQNNRFKEAIDCVSYLKNSDYYREIIFSYILNIALNTSAFQEVMLQINQKRQNGDNK